MFLASGCVCFVPVDEPAADASTPPGSETWVSTNSTWLSAGVAPDAGWNTDPSFDDSRWTPLTSLFPRDPLLPAEADSVWNGPGFSAGTTKLWARRTFTLSQAPTGAVLKAACNDDMEVWLNGTKLISDSDGVSTYRTLDDVRAQLVTGKNLLAATCEDKVGPEHAFYLLLTLQP